MMGGLLSGAVQAPSRIYTLTTGCKWLRWCVGETPRHSAAVRGPTHGVVPKDLFCWLVSVSQEPMGCAS